MRAALLAFALVGAPAVAALTSADLAGVGVTPAAGTRLPHLGFVDQNGAPFVLTPSNVPTVLLFADYTCGNVCGPGATLTAGALHDAGLTPGRDYRMVVIGLDRDGPARARRFVAERLQGLPQEAGAMRLLTGDAATVTAAERALGYHAAYDAAADQFAHDTALYLFTPDGLLSALLPETATAAPQMAAALARAKAGIAYVPPAPRDDSLAGRISTICYGLAAAHSLYGQTIVIALRAGGVALCVGLGGFLLWSARRRKVAA